MLLVNVHNGQLEFHLAVKMHNFKQNRLTTLPLHQEKLHFYCFQDEKIALSLQKDNIFLVSLAVLKHLHYLHLPDIHSSRLVLQVIESDRSL